MIDRVARGPILLAMALALFVHRALPLSDWLIDDAGISLAYARNLAAGAGLVSQPGAPPVEGFSNPLWTLLLAGFAAAGLLDVTLTPKLFSLALVVLAFALILREGLGEEGGQAWARALPVLLLPLNASFVIWSTSGLENALLVFLVVLSAVLSLRAAEARDSDSPDRTARLHVANGVVSGLLALTRPDALAYAVAHPLVVLVRGVLRRDGRRVWPALVRYASGFLPIFGGYLSLRIAYYGDWAPNTYYAKDRPSPLGLLDLPKLGDLLFSLVGPMSGLLLFLTVLVVVLLAANGRLGARHGVLGLYLALATAVYLVLPADWMGEYRFATAFFVFAYWFAGEAAGTLERLDGLRHARGMVAALGTGLLLATAVVHTDRANEFARGPIVPFARVAAFGGFGYNRMAEVLGHPQASLLTPDLGGTLFYSSLRVYDLAGLCDPMIARTLRANRSAFLDYVFERVRPTFIHAHGSWAEWAALLDDPRFARDYLPVSVTWERPPGRDTGRPDIPWTADYVRRDAVRGDDAALERLRVRFRSLGLPALSP